MLRGDTMARRAVQGYTDKTYFENGRFLGMLATNDPLQEGYFKHLVNFNISDTGLSVRPRKGFLTTVPRKTNEAKTLISISERAIIFKAHSLQEHIIYDFSNNRGYAVDISAYNIDDNKLIPITDEYIAADYNAVVDYLITEIPAFTAYYDAGVEAHTINIARSVIASYFLQHITLLHATQLNYVTNEYGVKKNLIKVVVEEDEAYNIEQQTLLLAFYYRKNAVPSLSLAANTLVFEILNLDAHPTYIISERNIASSKSIIPDPLQTLYTTENRPAGNVNMLGLLYVSSDDKTKYYIQYVPRVDLEIRPHFVLDPASLVLGDETAKWAYRIDIANINDPDNISRGNWLEYKGLSEAPVRIFPRPTGKVTTGASSARHYEGAQYVITLVPNDNSYCDVISNAAPSPVEPADYTLGEARYDAWRSVLDGTITDKRELLLAIDALEDLANSPRIHIKDLRNAETVFYISALWDDPYDYVKGSFANSDEVYDGFFITMEEFREYIEGNNMDSYNIAWRLLPLGWYLDETDDADDKRYHFRSINYWGHYTGDDLDFYDIFMVNTYDNYDNLVEKPMHNAEIDTEFIIQLSSTTLQGTNMPDFDAVKFLKDGFTFTFYMKPYLPAEVPTNITEANILKDFWADAANYAHSQQILYGVDSLQIIEIPEYQIDDPEYIQESENMMEFGGMYTVMWKNNTIYISEPGRFNYYKEVNKFEYAETVIKVLEFKNILLIFTSQHLYALYRDSLDTITGEGETQVTVTTEYWATQKVLYNIRTNEKYKDVIQVFNEFILFYSEDGQMFLIKPNTMIDSETRFSLKYFNQGVNDVLLNYDDYINERLANYNIQHTITKDDVNIKALLSVNFIKIFYYIPGYITYILVFDVINNRFFVYDTVAFTDIHDKMYLDSGELYITKSQAKLYLTMPYKELNQMDSNADMSIINNFKKIAISPLIDTGNMSLNNHLRKRFATLHTVFKNLSTSKLLFNVETELDDIVSHPFYDTQLEVHDIGGISYYVTVPKTDNNDLIDLIGDNQISDAASAAFIYAMENRTYEEDSLLLDFAEFTSSKLLTHRTSIRGKGKVLRLKMQFISKGDFKLQSFGIVYKERRI
jgi:hypothetical protein